MGVAEFALDVVLWRGGKAPVSSCLLAATLCSWLLASASSSYSLLSLASNALLLLLALLFLWAKAARLLGRPPPPVPDLQPAADRLASLLRSALADAADAFNHIAGGSPSSNRLLARAFLALSLLSFLAGSPAFRYPAVVAALTLPPLYVRWDMDAYLRLASLNLYRYELLYQRFSLACFRTARDWIMLDDHEEEDDHRLLLLNKKQLMIHSFTS